MIKKESVEVKVGIFVFIGILVLFIMVFSIGDFYFWNAGYSIKTNFKFVNGVQVSAPVRVAGVGVGEVKHIRIVSDQQDGETFVELTLWIQEGVKIPEDSVVTINMLGLLGEKYVEIMPGDFHSKVLKPGEQIRGKEPLATEMITEKAYAVASKMDKAVDNINNLLKDPELQDPLRQMLANTSEITESVKAILTQIESGQGTIGKLLYQDDIHQNLEELTRDLKEHPWKLLQKPKEKKEGKK